MGYRSEVGIVFKKSDEDLFYDKLREWDASRIGDGESAEELLGYANKETLYSNSLKEDCVVLSWTYVKWYDTYPAVQFFEDVKNILILILSVSVKKPEILKMTQLLELKLYRTIQKRIS